MGNRGIIIMTEVCWYTLQAIYSKIETVEQML